MISSSASSISPNSSASNQPSSLSPVIVGTSGATTTALSLVHQIGYCHADFLLHRRYERRYWHLWRQGPSSLSSPLLISSPYLYPDYLDRLGSDAQGWCDHGRRNAEQARIAEEAGACAVMALERVPSDIRRDGGVARMSWPKHESGILLKHESYKLSELITSMNPKCSLQPILSTTSTSIRSKFHLSVELRISVKPYEESEGAAMIRTKGEAGTGNVVEAVRHERAVLADIRRASVMSDEELYTFAKELSAPYHLLKEVARTKRLPVVNFAAGGIATPADAALMMQLGCDGVFVGSGIFKSDNPALLAKAIVQATTHHNNPQMLAEISTGLGPMMKGEGNLQSKDVIKMSARGY
ncbi:hypothetical protein PSTT_16891 [Puccinia striiformis]|uniref:pyridoxal 5'-phosphate synthase (glutamine hydrolyzing) n=1 Tax=Puccinia striiformis TaxID=27350 RepID=A0A2S4UAQ0_9BASI|nr:hypothetical protein PSTT_16891 [Puccinia striiformis]